MVVVEEEWKEESKERKGAGVGMRYVTWMIMIMRSLGEREKKGV